MDITNLKNSSLTRGVPVSNGNSTRPLSPITKKSSKRSRDRVRRWTTDVDRTHLIHPLVNEGSRDDSVHLSQDVLGSPTFLGAGVSTSSLSSWGSTDLESGQPHVMASQQDLLQEMAQLPLLQGNDSHHQYQLSYDLAIETSPLSPSTYGSSQNNHCGLVIREMVTTERNYLSDLSDIIEGYFKPLYKMVDKLPISYSEVEKMFGNIAEIRAFHTDLLDKLHRCGQDYYKIAVCFIDNAEGFKIYTQYCTNYPDSVKTLVRVSGSTPVARYMRQCQLQLHHTLPLGAYLLKPVQRVFKYSLLLESLFKHLDVTDQGYQEVQRAMGEMNRVAEHINSMKRKYDAAVHVQEIQSLLHDWEGGSLTKYGDIVLEDTFKVTPSKGSTSFRPAATVFGASERYVFLFQRLILITKKRDDGFHYRKHIEMKDVQLTEHLKDPTVFQIRHISTHRIYSFQVQNAVTKVEWTQRIKNLLVESLPQLPEKTRKLILSGFTTDLTKVSGATPEKKRRKSTEIHYGSPGRRPSPKPSPSFDVDSLAVDMDRVLTGSQTLPRKMPHKTSVTSNSPLLYHTSTAKHSTSAEELPDSSMEVPTPAQRDSGFFSESIPVLDDLRQPTHHSPSPTLANRDSSPTSSSPVSSSYQFHDEPVSSSNGTRIRRGRGYENNRRHSRSFAEDEAKTRIATDDYLTSHSATNSPIPPAPGSTSFSLDRTFTPPTITHDTHPVCLSLSTPDFQAKDWSTTTSSRTGILENGQPVDEEESYMTKSNSKGSFEPSILETIHSEGNTPQSSASHEELLASLQAAGDLASSPNPGRVIRSVRSNQVDDDIIDMRPSAEQTRRSYPAELQSRKSLSLPHFARKNHVHLQQRPASGDYDGQEALFEDLMGSSSDLGLPSLSQVLPEDESAPSPSFSRAVKAALFGKVDFGHAFSQTQSDSLTSEQQKASKKNWEAAASSLYRGVHRLSINEDESQTPKASPATQRRSSYSGTTTAAAAGTCSTQETVTPQGSPQDTRKLIEESNSDNFLPPPTPSSLDNSSINSSSISDTTIILPCPPEFASESPQLNRSRPASNSPRNSERKYSIPEQGSSGSLSPAIIRKDKSKTPEASSSIFKPFSVVRRAHSFSQTRRKQRPISVIGLVHTTRDNSDLLDLNDAIRLKRMTGEGSPILKAKGSPDLLSRRESDSAVMVSSLIESRSPVIRSNTSSPIGPNETDSPLDGSSSPDSISVPTTSSSRSPRTVRWSLLRPKGHKQKSHKADDQVGESSPNGSGSELLGVVEEGLHYESAKAVFEQDQAAGSATVQQHKAGDSLFAASQENGVAPRRKSKLRKRRDKRSLTIAGTELELSAMEQQQKPNNSTSRVFKLAREYSQKIKDRRFQRTSSTINVSLEEEDEKRHQVSPGLGVSLSQTHQNPDSSQTDPFVQEWLLDCKKASTNHHLTASKALSTNNLTELSTNMRVDIGSQTLSDGDKTPRESTTFDLPEESVAQKDDQLASSNPELPHNFQGPKSITISRFTSVADEMMMQGIDKEERRKGRFGGWVKSLVNKFGK